ncbi:EAL domain-containing protein [Yangia mangrovi]|uniref:EAL domain-containing protein n=1 Tax=Alloyangia mangrovi TaxID=1779329 RepID=A0A2A3JU58_9RHOB|nr:GGDEF and EAL domain-containing protein [Alloyangia mangrovi]MCT4369650.1 EAL domain-containing protein [Alloyangia mangrovi]
MISDLPDQGTFGRDDLPVSELDAFLDRIGAAALPLTGAVACLVDLPPEVVGPRAVRMAAPLDGPVAESLRSLVDNRPGALASGLRRQSIEATVDGRRLRFLIERIGGGRSAQPALPLGTIVLGFDAEAVSIAAAEKASRHFIAMLAALLVERRGKIAMAQDMAALGRQAAELQRRVRKDALTGLDNADAFRTHAREILGAGRGPHALVLMDVDSFKQINDLHGHQFGDVYLRAIAAALQGSVPLDARLGRIGGDEFALLLRLPAEAEPALLQVMRACSAASARLAETMGKPELGGISMGAAFYPRHGENYETLFEQADTALYAAKEAGRGAGVIFDPHRHLRFSLRELMRNFAEALAAGEIQPVFHPVVDLATGQCTGYEVLARWRGEDGEIIGPELFYPIFENPVLAEQLTRRMIVQATEVLRGLPVRAAVAGAPLRVGINVTGFDLHNPQFTRDFGTLLSDLGLPWQAIVIEVPETVMLGETGGRVFETLRELRACGAKIALDDFGTGYGSLRHLGAWPIDMLKIDRQFVQGLSARPRDRAVVEAILGMARRFGFRVVAEGIETPGQLSYLRAMGCDAGQGHLISAPLCGEALAEAPLIYPIGDWAPDEG